MKFRALIIIFNMAFGLSQDIDWSDSPGSITAMDIYCDTENISIYVDGQLAGVSPLSGPIQVAPGWHLISYFPPRVKLKDSITTNTRFVRDIVKLARQNVLVEQGETVKVVISYRTVEAEAKNYQKNLSSENWVGFAMMFLTVFLIAWGTM